MYLASVPRFLQVHADSSIYSSELTADTQHLTAYDQGKKKIVNKTRFARVRTMLRSVHAY